MVGLKTAMHQNERVNHKDYQNNNNNNKKILFQNKKHLLPIIEICPVIFAHHLK